MVTTFHQSSENGFFQYKTYQLQKKSTNGQFYINPAKKYQIGYINYKKEKKSTHNKDQQIFKTAQASVLF